MSSLSQSLKSPFPYFGGKSRAAELIWSRFGGVRNYVEPFFGSGAVLLKRPLPFEGNETVNDKDGMIANFWRALAHDPEATAHYADNPVNETDLHARHIWLVENRETLTARLEGDPEFYDAKVAGWWVWGISCWIGSGWCSGNGPWKAVQDDEGHRKLVHLGNSGRGVKRKFVHLGDNGKGVNRQLVHLGDNGKGVNRKRVHLGGQWSDGQGVIAKRDDLLGYFHVLADRLRKVRVCCGDWTRVMGESVTVKHGLTAVLLDPPYSNQERASGLSTEDCGSAPAHARPWSIENGDNPLLRIALCGYSTEHDMPSGWECKEWDAAAGYDGQNKDKMRVGQNRAKERIWFSPHCIKEALPLFG